MGRQISALMWGMAVIYASCVRAEPPSAPPVNDAVQQALQACVDQHQISGAVTLVARRGEIVHLGAVGQADIESSRPMTTDTLFWIASMTKPITATALMILQDEGKLSVDDPVARYLPEFALTPQVDGTPLGEKLTIHHLLTHTNGLQAPDWQAGGETRSLAEICRLMAEKPLKFAPGSKWEYGQGLTVVGRIIEVVSGQPYDVFVRERITQPLGMSDTTFHLTPEQRARLVTVYELNSDQTQLVPTTHRYVSPDPSVKVTPQPSGGLFSTAADMFRFYQMILNGGELDGARIVSPAAVQQMTTVQSGDVVTGFTPGNGWGLGWCIVREPQGVSEMLSPGTFGHGGAYGTQGWVDRERGAIFVLLIQRKDLGNSDGSDIRRVFQQSAVDALFPPAR